MTRIEIPVYSGEPNEDLFELSRSMWSGDIRRGVKTFLESKPDFCQLIVAITTERDFFPLPLILRDFSRKLLRLNQIHALEGLSLGARLEALSFCGDVNLLPKFPELEKLENPYWKANAVRSLARLAVINDAARLALLNDAARLLESFGGAVCAMDYYCLAADVMFSARRYREVIEYLEPFREQLHPRYLRMLGRSYARDLKTASIAIELLSQLPIYDYYRIPYVSRLESGKSIYRLHFNATSLRQIAVSRRYVNDVHALDKTFDEQYRRKVKLHRKLGGC